MTDAEELISYINDFLKRPIFPEQEAKIVCAMIDGTINKNTAKELFGKVIEQNLKRHNEIMNMSQEELLSLCDKYGVKNEVLP